VSGLRPIQLSKRDVLDALYSGRKRFNTSEWKNFLLRSVGLEPTSMTERNRDAMLLRMVPFVENNYNLVELGPRGTGKSHLYQQVSPYAHLVSGGKATVARMFVNNATGHRGLVCLYDVVCFDEIVTRAGLKLWDKPFQNLRASGETELAATFPIHTVCQWIGNSTLVAQKHYLQVTDDDVARAVESGAAKALQKPVQSVPANKERQGKGVDNGKRKTPRKDAKSRVGSTGGKSCTDGVIHPEGFEPSTFGSVDRCSIQLSYGCMASALAHPRLAS
jgi:bacteriophage exclusion system BrxL-like protein